MDCSLRGGSGQGWGERCPGAVFCTFAGERIAEGRAEGERAKACEIAAKLMAAGMSKEEAAEFVGIEEGEI